MLQYARVTAHIAQMGWLKRGKAVGSWLKLWDNMISHELSLHGRPLEFTTSNGAVPGKIPETDDRVCVFQ